MKPSRLSILCFTLILLAGIVHAESPSYCIDKESWKVWDAFVAEHYDDDGVQALHALRLGLCTKIEAGSISLDRAIDIFDKAHLQLVMKWREEARKPPEEGITN